MDFYEDFFIEHFSKTITHEFLHFLIGIEVNAINPDKYNRDKEEEIVQRISETIYYKPNYLLIAQEYDNEMERLFEDERFINDEDIGNYYD